LKRPVRNDVDLKIRMKNTELSKKVSYIKKQQRKRLNSKMTPK